MWDGAPSYSLRTERRLPQVGLMGMSAVGMQEQARRSGL
jgi:hypothetical protein